MFLWFTDCLAIGVINTSMKPWSYKWCEFGLFQQLCIYMYIYVYIHKYIYSMTKIVEDTLVVACIASYWKKKQMLSSVRLLGFTVNKNDMSGFNEFKRSKISFWYKDAFLPRYDYINFQHKNKTVSQLSRLYIENPYTGTGGLNI